MDEFLIGLLIIICVVLFQGEPDLHDSLKFYVGQKSGAIPQGAEFEKWCNDEDLVMPMICKQGESND